jgi:hypothetical protein
MIHHISISAQKPQHVAEVLAKIYGCSNRWRSLLEVIANTL